MESHLSLKDVILAEWVNNFSKLLYKFYPRDLNVK